VALFVLAGLGGAAVGLVRGGRADRLLALRLRAAPLAWACLVTQVVLGLIGDGPLPLVREVALVATYAGIGAWLALNAVSHGGGVRLSFAVLLAGWVLNVVPMVLNDGMPVSTAARRAVGATDEVVDQGHLWKHVVATRDTEAAWLGDVVPVAPLGAVISTGDVLLLVGVAGVIASGLRRAV
jgi:hypothetical protein